MATGPAATFPLHFPIIITYRHCLLSINATLRFITLPIAVIPYHVRNSHYSLPNNPEKVGSLLHRVASHNSVQSP
jgi:hypothetical protein